MSKTPNQKVHHPTNAFITGTDTGVGKTAVTAALGITLQKQGFRVGVMKPVETGVPKPSQKIPVDDGARLHSIFGSHHPSNMLSLYQFPDPLAPLAASRRMQQPIDVERINTRYQELSQNCDFVLVEGAGGVLVPLTTQETVRDLIWRLQIPCIVVSRPTLGAVNHTLLTLQALRDRGIGILAVALNQSSSPPTSPHEQLQMDSTIQLLREFCGTPVVGPFAFEPLLNTDWMQGVSKLANDPAMAQLSEILMEKV
jgi:dethiobiotin synthetase